MSAQGWAGMPYTLYADSALLQRGVLDNTTSSALS